jgi:hypothetical protein
VVFMVIHASTLYMDKSRSDFQVCDICESEVLFITCLNGLRIWLHVAKEMLYMERHTMCSILKMTLVVDELCDA